jgi:hypothetical protein
MSVSTKINEVDIDVIGSRCYTANIVKPILLMIMRMCMDENLTNKFENLCYRSSSSNLPLHLVAFHNDPQYIASTHLLLNLYLFQDSSVCLDPTFDTGKQ